MPATQLARLCFGGAPWRRAILLFTAMLAAETARFGSGCAAEMYAHRHDLKMEILMGCAIDTGEFYPRRKTRQPCDKNTTTLCDKNTATGAPVPDIFL